MPQFDVVIIGTGSAGFSAAEAAKNMGASVCVIEKEKLGGECPNWACSPTKALLRCAKVFRGAKHAGEFGVQVRRVEYDFGQIMAYKDKVVTAITGGGEVGKRYEAMIQELGLGYFKGSASFQDPYTVLVRGSDGETETVEGRTFVLATGSVEFIPSIDGIQEVPYMTSRDAVSLTAAPASIVIIGGGPVGSEFATFFGTFGIPTTLIQKPPVILHREDAEISELAGKAMKELGVRVIANADIVRVGEGENGQKRVTVAVGDEETDVNAELILMATGKRANVEGLNLAAAGVKLDERMSVQTNERQETSAPHIYAAGDVDGGLQFTHTAHHEGTIAGANAALRSKKKTRGFWKTDERVVPRVTFVEPEVASVGMTALEVKKEFGSVVVGRFPVGALGRAVTDSESRGLIKIVAHPETGEVIGGHMIGPSAGEVIHEIALAMHLRASLDDLGGMIHAFPTYAEAVAGAAGTIETL